MNQLMFVGCHTQVLILVMVKKQIELLFVLKFKTDFPRIGIGSAATRAARNPFWLKPKLVSAKFDHIITSADAVTAGFELATDGNLKESEGLP